MRLPLVAAVASVSAAAGLLAGWMLVPTYGAAPAYPVRAAHCVYEAVSQDGDTVAPVRIVSIITDGAWAAQMLLSDDTSGPPARIVKLAPGVWSATATFTHDASAAMLTVRQDGEALLSIHRPNGRWSAQVGTCPDINLKASV